MDKILGCQPPMHGMTDQQTGSEYKAREVNMEERRVLVEDSLKDVSGLRLDPIVLLDSLISVTRVPRMFSVQIHSSLFSFT